MVKNYKKLIRAQSAISLKKYKLAINLAEELLHENPNDEFAYITLAEAYAFLKNFDKARIFAQIALSCSPHNELILCIYSSILLITKEYEECINVVNKVLEIYPRNESALFNKMFILVQKHQYIEAENIAEFLLELNPNNSLYYITLAQIYNSTNRQISAKKLYKKALQLNPLNTLALNDYAVFLMTNEYPNYDEALILLSSSLKLNPNNNQVIKNYESCYKKKKILDYVKEHAEYYITAKEFLACMIFIFFYSIITYKNLDAFIFCLIFISGCFLFFILFKKILHNKG